MKDKPLNGEFFFNTDTKHRISLHKIIVALALKLAKNFTGEMERDKLEFQDTLYVFRHPGAYCQKHKRKFR